jgi:hypothetical protein
MLTLRIYAYSSPSAWNQGRSSRSIQISLGALGVKDRPCSGSPKGADLRFIELPGWKFNKPEIEDIISKIERIKILVSLALTNDNL